MSRTPWVIGLVLFLGLGSGFATGRVAFGQGEMTSGGAPLPATPTPPSLTLTVPDQVVGTLTPASPMTRFSPILQNGQRVGRYFTDYLLTGIQPGQPIRVSLKSPEFEGDLAILESQLGLVIAHTDLAANGSETEVEFIVQPDTTYIVRVSSIPVLAEGEFTLSAH